MVLCGRCGQVWPGVARFGQVWPGVAWCCLGLSSRLQLELLPSQLEKLSWLLALLSVWLAPWLSWLPYLR